MRTELDDPKRFIPMEGAFNFRDMGGYQAADGKKVKWGLVYRSDSLEKLTESDLNKMAELSMKSYIDFRSTKEVERGVDRQACTVQNCFALPISAGDMMDLQAIKSGNGRQVMIDVNKALVSSAQVEYHRFFEIVQNIDNAPLLFHCTAGKDRAGFAAALFLSALGVPRDTIYADFELSAKYIMGKYGALVKEKPILLPVLTVEKAYLEAAFAVIDSQYGGSESYLVKQLGVDLKLMRDLYAE